MELRLLASVVGWTKEGAPNDDGVVELGLWPWKGASCSGSKELDGGL